MGGAGAAAGAVALAGSAGAAVSAAGEFTRHSVLYQLNDDEHHHREHHSPYSKAAPVVLKKFQHIRHLPKTAGG